EGIDAQRLATRALMHRPWSADSKELLYIVNPTPTASPAYECLCAVAADGTHARPIGPSEGVVENASWLAGTRVVFTHRRNTVLLDSPIGEDESCYVVDAATGWIDEREAPIDTLREAVVADLAPSPDGRYLASLELTGPRDARKRQVRIFDTQSARSVELGNTERANFLTWTNDSSRLYFLSSVSHAVSLWMPEDTASRDAKMADVAAMVAIDGALLALDTSGVLATRNLETGARGKELGRDFVPISAAAKKVALVRRGPAGAAIVVADVDAASLDAGDIGLPKSAPAAPPEMPSDPPRPPASGENGSLSAPPAGAAAAPQPPG
ncbi:MAG TPA: hypothetical protein VHF22_00765, partial [Planctomycetota bacterium]|nr:hypothetical protein [Planctomycetota bacterium]